ncbi:MAG: cytochrome C oxidase subunit IV family protein [Gammaproteobacteria bacterium]|nr:cytochrome C oxidase subunit IV family protein [Gammaproteobacteria bacterium]
MFIRPCTWVWIILMLLTLAVLFIGQAGLGGTTVVCILLISTFVKTQMVADYFMGLKRTRLIWRAIVTVYLLLVMSLIGLAYWLSLS